MKWLVLIFVVLTLGAILGPISSGNAGYVLVQFAGWSFETSVIALLIISIMTLVVLALVIALLRSIFSKTRKGSKWFGKRRSAKAEQASHQAQIALLEHDYLTALQWFEKSFKYTKDKHTAALAAFSAQQCQELGKAEFWRTQAGKAYESADTVIQRKYIESLQLQQPELAQRKLDALLQQKPSDAKVWRLAVDLFTDNKQWQSLIRYFDDIQRNSQLATDDLNALLQSIYYHRFIDEGVKSNDALYDYWRALEKSQRNRAQIRLAYAGALRHLGNKEACAKIIYKGLKRGDLSIAAVNHAKVLCANYPKLVEYVQDALKRNPTHADYLRALAMLAYSNKDYSLAQRALRKLNEADMTQSDYQLLGDVYHSLGDSQLAANAYKKALA